MIKIKNLSKKYNEHIIFEDASITINSGDFIAIKGESGSGKTTLLNIIGLLEQADEIDYRFDDALLPNQKSAIESIRRKSFSYVFQDACLISYLNCYDNIVMPLKNLKIQVSKDKVEEIARQLNIENILYKNVTKLSGGEKTRVAIARAILTGNPYVLADEPTGNLDPKTSLEVMEIFKTLNKDLHFTIIMVTHTETLDSFFNRILYIAGGKIDEAS